MQRANRNRIGLIALVVQVALAMGTASAAVSVYLAPEQLAERAALVVEGTVASTRSGLDPQTGALHTYVTLTLDEVHRGPADLTELVLREPGGQWGELVHVIDAVPVYQAGERVFVFLEPARDGALRTVGMFFGKFGIGSGNESGPLTAVRDLEGQGTILGRSEMRETLTRNDLIALTATNPLRVPRGTAAPRSPRGATRVVAEVSRPKWSTRPPEWERLAWNTTETGSVLPQFGPTAPSAQILNRGFQATLTPAFVALSASNPARWVQSDNGAAVSIQIEPGGNPLNDNAAAASEIGRALAAWTDVPEARLQLSLGNTNYDYTASNLSPASTYTGTNIVLFNDPYDDISDPTGCGGVLAIGGYWRSGSTGSPVNNVTFHPALALYVIFNNNFECYLGNADNLAEVATHEIGHGIGFGHSNVSDAIMRSSAYGNRGPRLGADDQDAAHCHYPHQLNLLSPNGGETLLAGSLATVSWSTSDEAGVDDGTVDLEYSTDNGVVWKDLASGTANDGSHSWIVPDDPSARARVRVARHARSGTLPAPYPTTICSYDVSNAALSIIAAAPVAGRVGNGLLLSKGGAGELRADWSASCSAAADDYAIYQGSLSALRAGSWDHAPLSCQAGVDLFEQFTPAPGLTYYLVAPRAGSSEGSLGVDSSGQPRPEALAACAPRESEGC